jgi:hypothetical protein
VTALLSRTVVTIHNIILQHPVALIHHSSTCFRLECNIHFYFKMSLQSYLCSRKGLVKWDLWWTKWRWGRFSPSTSVSPANFHSTNCSTITLIYHLGLYNRPEVAAVPGDVSPTPIIIIIKKSYLNFLKCHENHILFHCCDMFRPYKDILRQLLID